MQDTQTPGIDYGTIHLWVNNWLVTLPQRPTLLVLSLFPSSLNREGPPGLEGCLLSLLVDTRLAHPPQHPILSGHFFFVLTRGHTADSKQKWCRERSKTKGSDDGSN